MMLDPELNELRREFLVEADEKVREMQTALDGERNRIALDRLAYLAHQLKGSGGSYGYQRISADAAELERAIETLTAGSPDQKIETKIQEYVVSLRAEIERGSKELAAAS